MALSVYTKLLYSNVFPTTEVGLNIGGPAVGLRWVLRDIVVQDGATQYVPRTGFALLDDNNVTIYASYYDRGLSGYFHWQGRQVLDNPHHLLLYTYESNTSIRITGYELTLP